MTGLARKHLIFAFFALMALRMVIGFHFFIEGSAKVREGDFDSAPFLKLAKGPFASFYLGMIDDSQGHWRLCISDQNEFGEPIKPNIDTELTFAIWSDFVERAERHYSFGDPMLIDVLENRIKEANGDALAKLKEQISLVKKQKSDARRILNEHQTALANFFEMNRDEILRFVNSRGRLDGFDRDGQNKNAVASDVPSIRDQVESIQRDRNSASRSWFTDIEALWDSLETKINGLAVAEQTERGNLNLHRPYKQSNSMHSVINQVIPWFDLIVGALLLIGLFTRFASLAAIVFLLSVVLSQPFWVQGTQDTWLQLIEIAALVVLFATCAGRYGGVDYFFNLWFGKKPVEAREA